MAAIITKDTRLLNAKAFVESVAEAENTVYYVFLGKPTTWPTEYAPPQAADDYATQRDIWNNMEAMKLVTTSDVVHAIPRYNWKAGNIYAQYNDRIPSANLFDFKFFVVNSEFNVYKCLSNGLGHPNVTVSEPTGTGSTNYGIVQSASDAYVWKFMYNIPPGTWVKFGTTSFIPVTNATSATANLSSNVQGIYGYNIINANVGSSVTGDGLYYLKVVGNGDGNANALIRITNGNVFGNLLVRNFGNNYSKAKVTGLFSAATAAAESLGNVVIEPILAPPDGHGNDPIDELGGIYAMVNVRFEQDDAPTIPVDNFKFRQIGVIKDPLLSTSFHGAERVPKITSANTLLRVSSNITIDGVITNQSKLLSGAVLRGTTSGANATVVSYAGNVINYVQAESTSSNVEANFKSLSTGEILYIDNAQIGTVLTLGNSAVRPYSGEIIYVDNRNVITRATDQVEDVYVVIEF